MSRPRRSRARRRALRTLRRLHTLLPASGGWWPPEMSGPTTIRVIHGSADGSDPADYREIEIGPIAGRILAERLEQHRRWRATRDPIPGRPPTDRPFGVWA